ncbi:PREDICTED: molybdate-anion transporter-like [Branchiostoma belcheri]|uniref:Molybdate-anion transporter-like n=1 Tax=Branchiostoma belcheri TaxID=7741 RepID=A0A6P4YGC5_BRABE|nr:PREDICTED: molybdate-anion transporter-like [Branchiostoma belcheri]
MVFVETFYVLVGICVVLFLYTRTAIPSVEDRNFQSFQRTYLVVYLLGAAGDWMQGPHVYALYQSYGMTTHQIEQLFVAGFGSSMVFGTVVGSFADKIGRRTNCILYGILYSLACVTKHFANFWILMVGRLLGGVATSILFSAFDSWLVCEHNARGFDRDLLGSMFSLAVLGNSVVAISAGIVAQVFADRFGFVAPFDVSAVLLVIMCILAVFTWTENYGDSSVNLGRSLVNALKAIKQDRKILCLGLIQSLFEGAMYTFVLEWTPALTPASQTTGETPRETIPHGWIFADFMVAVMIGSSLFKILCKFSTPESFMRPVFFIAALSLSVPIFMPGQQVPIFLGFLTFEVCVGMFWPALSTLKGKYVPEETRATVYNCFRIPLNMIVISILLQNLGMSLIFKCCSGFLMVACLAQQWVYTLAVTSDKPTAPSSPNQETSGSKKPLIEDI